MIVSIRGKLTKKMPDEIVIEEPEDDMRAARIETTNSFLAFTSH